MPSEIEYYDETSRNYNELHGEEQLNKLRIIADHIEIKTSDSLLDVGCGSGLSAQVFKCNITGIDPSEELLKKCPFKTIQASAESIPFPDHSFNVVIAVTCIHNFSNIKKGLEEIRRVGKNKFAFSILKKSAKLNEIELLISKYFRISKRIEEEKDIIFVCS